MAIEKMRGAISLATNSIGSSTGYGVQGLYLAERLLKHGFNVANLSNYGYEGQIGKIRTKQGDVTHYPKGFKPYSDDVLPIWHKDFSDQHPTLKNAVITLYDTWVYNDLKFDGDIFAWTPLDHVSLPPNVLKFLLRRNVTPITMSPHGQRQLEAAGVESTYIPHGVDTKVMKPTHDAYGVPVREYLGVPDDAFLVGMVAANKANGLIHRKALAEALFAFSVFKAEHPDAMLYLHMEPSNAFGGFIIPRLLKAVGLDQSSVVIANSDVLRIGYPPEVLAAFMTACDVGLTVSYGEGFGVPQVEFQACGTSVIASSWAASPDLAGEDSWLIEGQPFWDEPQASWYQIPLIDSVVSALNAAYDSPRGKSEASVKFAKQFDVEAVWNWYWLPFLRERFA
jgi:glycosyltransferase involved in cell wall biosynthesis